MIFLESIRYRFFKNRTPPKTRDIFHILSFFSKANFIRNIVGEKPYLEKTRKNNIVHNNYVSTTLGALGKLKKIVENVRFFSNAKFLKRLRQRSPHAKV